MAKKSKTRAPASPAPQRQAIAHQHLPWWRQKFLWGSCILILVIGVGVFVRYVLFRPASPNLQGATNNHYTRGIAGAPVVLKEFSDYT
jgi:hypothetical protein